MLLSFMYYTLQNDPEKIKQLMIKLTRVASRRFVLHVLYMCGHVCACVCICVIVCVYICVYLCVKLTRVANLCVHEYVI